jgi:hypothetical protein
MSGDELQQMIDTPEAFEITNIKILSDKAGALPNNEQSGPTCGIYGLHAALLLRGEYAPPARKSMFNDDDGTWRSKFIERKKSFRGQAKIMGLSQTGEISGPHDLVALAAGCGFATEAKRFDSGNDLWQLVKSSIDGGKSIVFPYYCNADGFPAWKAEEYGFTHWCLLCGYAEYKNKGLPRIFLTTYGKFFDVWPTGLFKSNQRIGYWRAQTWIKIPYWFKAPDTGKWAYDSMAWMSEKDAVETVWAALNFMKSGFPNMGFALGKDKNDEKSLLKLIDPPTRFSANIAEDKIKQVVFKSVRLQAVPYQNTMRNQCVVV